MMFFRICIALLFSFGLSVSTFAEQEDLPVSASTIRQLHSAAHFTFQDWRTQAGTIENGWFAANADVSKFALMNRSGEIVVASVEGQIVDRYSVAGTDGLPATVLDMAFEPDGQTLVSAHAEGGAYYAAYRNIEQHTTRAFRFSSMDVPLRIWASGLAWLEISPSDYTRSRYIQRLDPRDSFSSKLLPSEVYELPSGPENDPDSFLRIGRIEPPFAITITQQFVVKRWNMESGEVTASAQLDALPGIGQLTADGRYFAWRDGESKAVHLLDFLTGKDRVIAQLHGTYVPFLLLNSTADVIIGVNVALKPIVMSWDVDSGEEINLGTYQHCGRQPDMVRLSLDDKTLVIGCDKGLDYWKVKSQ